MELLAGELSPAEDSSLRSAIEDCDDCGAEFEMMALLMDFSGAPLKVEAPREIDAVIMAAAKAHTEQVHANLPAEPTQGIWARLGAWLESFALGPQFAMATVMVLVVAVGFWYVPKHESHEVAGSTVVLSDPEGEAIAADDPRAAPPLLGAGETRQEVTGDLNETERLSLNMEEQVPVEEQVPEPLIITPPTKVARNTMRPQNRNPRPTAPAAPLPPTVRTQTDMAMTRAATRMSAPPGRMIENQGTDDVENLQQQSAAWAQDLEGIPMPTYSDDPVPSPRSPAPSASAGGSVPSPTADEGEAWVDRPEDRVAPPTTSPSRALLQLARNHRSQGACVQAVRHYESLLARFASSPEVAPALMESADCYRRLGRISDAERALRRALQFASTRTNARRELTRLETIRAAQREANSPSAESDFESSY